MNIFNILQESAEKWPDHSAIIQDDNQVDFATLNVRTGELLHELQNAGVSSGSAVAIIFPNGIDFIISLMAAVGTGAVVMPIYHQQKENEIKEALKDGQMHFVLSDRPLPQLKGVVNLISEISIYKTRYYLFATQRNTDNKTAEFIDQPAFMRFTSGTTGIAKGVIITHQSVLERITSANDGLQLTEKDKVIWVLPMAFHFVVSIVLFLKYGVTIVVNNSFLANDILSCMTSHKVTFLYGSPMHIKLLAAHRETVELPHLKQVVSTTTAIDARVCHQFFEKYKVSVSQAYGIIEIGLPIINTKKSIENPEAVGYCLPAYTVGILDANFNELEDNTTGLLGIKGPGMFAGYLTPPRLCTDVVENDWFMTGDLAVRDASGLITVKGRKKNVINVSGNKVFPLEVEEVVNAFEGVIKCKAYAKEHVLLGEIVALDVVLETEFTVDKEELTSYSRQYLSDYKVPQVVNFVDEIEMTASGKIKR